MAFTSNLAAINAANASLKVSYASLGKTLDKDSLKQARAQHFSIEKHDNEWHALLIAPLPEAPAPRDPAASLADEREPGESLFPTQAIIDACNFHNANEAQRQADALANEQALADSQSQATGNSPKVWIHSSSVAKPTKLVWIIADEMLAHAAANQLPVPSRKEVQDECIRRGVASGTARTQYQAWKTARDNALKNAEHAAALSAAFNRKPQA